MTDTPTKNIQIIDGAANCTYSLFQATETEFGIIFPEKGQDVEFIEDLVERVGEAEAGRVPNPIWERPVKKEKARGIHGTLYFDLYEKKKFYPSKRETEIDPLSISPIQRKILRDPLQES